MRLFINYFAEPERFSPFNLLVARVVLAAYAIWKLLSYRLGELQHWPDFLFEQSLHSPFLPFVSYREYLPYVQWTIAFLIILVAIGVWRKWAAFLAALLLAHTIAIHYVVTNSGATFLPVVYALILYAVFEFQDPYHRTTLADIGRRGWTRSKSFLQPGKASRYRLDWLKWMLVVIGMTYAFTGLSKMASAQVNWFSPYNLSRTILRENIMSFGELLPAAALMIQSEVVLTMSTIATIIFEVGLILVIILRRRIDIFVLGLLGMHVMIALTMGIFFFDQFILFALFVPWDALVHRFTRGVWPTD
ncbi:MAG: hypothetical protein WEC84_01300 [Candidatus Andersenbacteria bacterium]